MTNENGWRMPPLWQHTLHVRRECENNNLFVAFCFYISHTRARAHTHTHHIETYVLISARSKESNWHILAISYQKLNPKWNITHFVIFLLLRYLLYLVGGAFNMALSSYLIDLLDFYVNTIKRKSGICRWQMHLIDVIPCLQRCNYSFWAGYNGTLILKMGRNNMQEKKMSKLTPIRMLYISYMRARSHRSNIHWSTLIELQI